MSAGNTVYESRQCQYQADQGSRYCRANRDVVELNQEVASLKEKVKSFEQENAHLRKVNGIKLKKTTIKQSLVYANDALVKEKEKVKELETTAETYSNEWDISKKQASSLAEKVEQKDVKIKELELKIKIHESPAGQEYLGSLDEALRQKEAQIALLRAGLEKIERLSINFMNETGGIIREPLNRIQELAEQALSSSPSEFLEAIREAIDKLSFFKTSVCWCGLRKCPACQVGEALSKLRRFVSTQGGKKEE